MMNQVISLCSLRSKIYPTISIGRLVGYMLFLSYFTLLPALLKLMWPWMLTNLQINTIYIGSVFVLNVGLFIIYNTIMYFIYMLKIPFFEQYRNTQDPWPWEQNPQEWQKLKKKTFKYIFVNFFIVTPLMVWVSLQTSLPYEFSVERWPTKAELVFQFILFLLVEDVLFYFSHQLLHQPSFYWIHKIHHQYHRTIGITSHYVHPIEYILSGTLPSSLGFQILSFITPVHYSTVLVWLIFRLLQSYEGHCGYQWTWNILSLFPATVGSDYHDFHHSNNAGNYGSVFVFWDALFNTQEPYLKYLKKKVKGKMN